MRYSKFPCADHSNEPLKAEIVFARGLHDSLSFISIAKKKLYMSHLCNRRHTSQIRISETFFIELARIRSILLQYKEYMGQALYQERGAMPVRSFAYQVDITLNF